MTDKFEVTDLDWWNKSKSLYEELCSQQKTLQIYIREDAEPNKTIRCGVYNLNNNEQDEGADMIDLKNLSPYELEERLERYESALAKLVEGASSGALDTKYAKRRKAYLRGQLNAILDEQDSRAKKATVRAQLLEMDVYEKETVLLFKRDFSGVNNSSNIQYTYAAVKADNDLWYITGRNASRGLSWNALVASHLYPAYLETGELWAVSGWEKVVVED